MARKAYYQYNPETDNFERAFPSLGQRLKMMGRTWALSLAIGLALFLIVFYVLDSPTLKNLREQNAELRANYSVLEKRLDNALAVMDVLRQRDDNFYRVMMQLDPLEPAQRLSGLDNDKRYQEFHNLTDADLMMSVSRNMELLERQILTQVQSYDQLRDAIGSLHVKMSHIPASLPIRKQDVKIAAGFGLRRDPVHGKAIFHEGIDFAASVGTPVYAPAQAVVKSADREQGYGNTIDLDHGFNYLSRYAHLSEIFVNPGDTVFRGQMIGRIGSTGKSYAPHLHYEVRLKGEAQNPVNYCFLNLTPSEFQEMIQNADNAGLLLD